MSEVDDDLTPPSRPWSLDELRRAVRLAYGSRRGGGPNVGPVASVVGVSERTVQRWLAGNHKPKMEHLEALRAAVLPDEAVLRRQAKDVEVARAAIPALKARRAAKATARWRSESWHRRHRLFVLESTEWGICCPSILLEDRIKPAMMPRAWTVVDSVLTANRPEAVLVRDQLLSEVSVWRLRVDPRYSQTSSMCWLATAPRPALQDLYAKVKKQLA